MAKIRGGTKAWAIIAIVYGFVALFLTAVGAMGVWIIKNNPESTVLIQLSSLDILSSVIAFTLAISFCVCGIGVLLAKEWARKIIIWAAIVAIPNGLYGGLSGALKQPVPSEIQVPIIFIIVLSLLTITPFMVAFGFCIWYFRKASTKEQFIAS